MAEQDGVGAGIDRLDAIKCGGGAGLSGDDRAVFTPKLHGQRRTVADDAERNARVFDRSGAERLDGDSRRGRAAR